MFGAEKTNLRVTVVGAQGLYKSDRFSFPNPFAVLTINSEQERRTIAVDKSVAPYWNETFDVIATTFSILTIRVFDQKKFEKKGSGFLGVVNFSVSSVFESDARESKIVEKDLQISKNGELVSHGKLVVQLSWIALSVAEDRTASTQRAFTKAFIGLAVSAAQSRMVREWAKPHQVVASGSRDVDGLDRVQAPPVEHNQAVTFSGATSQDASLAWTRKYGKSHINLELEDPAPFTTTRRLGGGGIGIVYETQLDGFALALKTTYTPRLSDEHLNEIKILSRISATRHKHIVGLIGSYVHRQRRGYELGLLIWPVAYCDLSLYLKDIDALGSHLRGTSPGMLTAKRDSIESTALENLCIVGGVDLKFSVEALTDNGKAIQLFQQSSEVLRSRLGCIANAVAWLHREGIRHKDLKPSQILLSPGGLWLTDFGWSKDISELAQSTTSEGDNITLKYQSPERAQKKPCGRPEDIFALGCIFLEMVYQLVKTTVSADQPMAPWQQKGWYFQAHIDQEYELLGHIKEALFKLGYGVELFELIIYMLVVDPEDRPTIDEVVVELASSGFSCCTSESQIPAHDNHPPNDLTMSPSQNHIAPPNAPEYSQSPIQGLHTQLPFPFGQQYNPTYTYHGHQESASLAPLYHQSISTVNNQNMHNSAIGTTSMYVDNNSSTTTLLRHNSSTPNLDASLSSLQLTDNHIPPAYPPPPRDPGQIPRANTFTTTPARMSSNRMMLKKAISGLDRQLNGLISEDNKLRNLVVPGRLPAVPSGAQVNGQNNTYMSNKDDGEN